MMENKDWTLIKPYLWEHKDNKIQLMSFTNDNQINVRCVYIKMETDGEWMSNYFVWTEEDENYNPFEYAVSIIKQFKESQAGKNDKG